MDGTGQSPARRRTLLGDTERDRLAALLREHYAAGRLSLDELRRRAEIVFASAYLDEAVADAADLVEQTAQAFVGVLQQRQRRLRGIWDGDARSDGAAEQITDTEQLRLVMQRYRSLFDQLCRP